MLAKDIPTNIIIAGQGHDHQWLFSRTLTATQLNWISGPPPALPLRCQARTRYRQADQACEIRLLDNGYCQVVFEQPQRAVTPGQSIVFYQGDVCLGGGIIDTTDSIPDAEIHNDTIHNPQP